MRIGKARKMIACLAPLGLLLLISACYRSSEFRGGSSIRDNGTFSYPRYYAEVGHFPLKDGEYTYTVSGLPPDPLTLELLVKDGSESQ
jgi:hypothetical protein